MSKHYQGKKLAFQKLPTPKHAEEYSTRESGMWQPWKITLKVYLRPEDLTPIDYPIYCRADSPDHAQWTAYYFFLAINDINPDSNEDPNTIWPQVVNDTPILGEGITEEEYMDAYDECKKSKYKAICGDKRNPSMFAFLKPGWDNGIISAPTAQIYTPTQAQVDAVTKSKLR